MRNRKNRKKLEDIKNKAKTNERIEKYNAIKKLVRDNKMAKALSDIENYTLEYPDDCFGTLLHGTILTGLGHLDEAKEIFEELVTNRTRNMYTAIYELGCIEKRKNNLEKAKEYYIEAIENSPYEEDFSKIELAQILIDEEQNLEYAKKILNTVSPSHKNNAHLEISRIELKQGKAIAAYNEISQITLSDNENFEKKVNLQKGKIESALGNYQGAIEYFEKAMAGIKNATYWITKLEIAKLQIQLGNSTEALKICDTLISKRYYIQNEVYLVKGLALVELKDYDAAKENYNKLFEINKEINYQKGNLYLGLLELKLKQYDKALSYLKKVESGRMYKRAALFNMIHASIRKEDFENAELYMKEMIEEKFINKSEEEYRKLRIVLDKAQNLPIKVGEYKTYAEEQYANYNLKKAISHIVINHYNYCANKSRFSEELDIKKLMPYIQEQIKNKRPDIEDFADVYYVNYKDVGTSVDGTTVDNIRVVTVPLTKNIITMYPYSNIKVQKKEEQPKVKRMSQIEKFNKKYNLK